MNDMYGVHNKLERVKNAIRTEQNYHKHRYKTLHKRWAFVCAVVTLIAYFLGKL